MNERVDFLENLLDHIESISWKSLKKEVRERSIVFLADTIGVGLSAAGLPDTRRLSALSKKWGPGHSQPLGGSPKFSTSEGLPQWISNPLPGV